MDGTVLSYIRGVIQTRTTGYYIGPMYPNDMEIAVTPPAISKLKRNPAVVLTNQAVTLTANVTDDGSVDSVRLYYRVDGGNYSAVNMTPGSGSSYSGNSGSK